MMLQRILSYGAVAVAVAGLGLGISVVAGGYATMLIDQQKAQGVTGEALAKFTAEMERFKAALLRNSRFLPARRPVAGQ